MLGPHEPSEPDESSDDTLEERRGLPGVMVAGTAALVLLGLALTVFAGPLYDYVDRAAAGLRGGVYLEAVLSGVVQ